MRQACHCMRARQRVVISDFLNHFEKRTYPQWSVGPEQIPIYLRRPGHLYPNAPKMTCRTRMSPDPSDKSEHRLPNIPTVSCRTQNSIIRSGHPLQNISTANHHTLRLYHESPIRRPRAQYPKRLHRKPWFYSTRRHPTTIKLVNLSNAGINSNANIVNNRWL